MSTDRVSDAPRPRRPAGLASRLGVDPRALAALRVALGALLVLDLALRAGDLVAFYTDAGVLPRSALAARYGSLAELSVHGLTGGPVLQAGLLAVTAAVAVALLAGYRARLAALLAFVLLTSLHIRNPLLLTAGDSLLRRLLLWGALLPLGARWSIDARDGDGLRSTRILSVASAGLLLQVVIVYAVNAVVKLRGETWPAGDGLATVMRLDHLTVRFADVIAGQPLLLEALGRTWLAMLVLAPLLVLLRGHGRTLFATMFVGAHLAMLLTMKIGVFPLISVAALLPFYPPRVWDAVERATAPLADRAERSRLRDRVGRLAARLPRAGATVRAATPRVARPAAAVLLVLVLVWNAAALGYIELSATAGLSAEERRWDMFAPEPTSTTGWPAAPARTHDGRRVDAYHLVDGPAERPDDFADAYPNSRWSKYVRDLLLPANAGLRDDFARYLCRRWAARRDTRLGNLSLVYHAEPAGGEPEDGRRRDLGGYDCPSG